MKFSQEDTLVLQMALIGRRNRIVELLEIKAYSEETMVAYRRELERVDAILERFSPGCLQRMGLAT